jgi:hypothetical protein
VARIAQNLSVKSGINVRIFKYKDRRNLLRIVPLFYAD